VRVISGSAKGIQLASVPGESTRPITDRVKEALFDILGSFIVDARVLDLFAGTGAVGIEALSRGAREAVFVERERRALATIRRNLAATRLGERARVVAGDAFSYLAQPPAEPFDLIYIAPPQYRRMWLQALQAIDRPGYLSPDGLAIVQIFPKEDEPVALQHLERTEERKYGSTLLVFYEPVEAQASQPPD
jgi:16S rRNA (guanine966-N2)-methyltransferase